MHSEINLIATFTLPGPFLNNYSPNLEGEIRKPLLWMGLGVCYTLPKRVENISLYAGIDSHYPPKGCLSLT